jgi:SAM-dependent methyltransferase
VALYSLANPALLRAATEEVVARLRDWGLLAGRPAILDLGCGIGRFEEALAAEARLVVGVDISREMLKQALSRCAGLPNAYVLQTSGRDLACFADASFDLVLAADVFPYLAQSAGDLLERHVFELGRVLRPGGDALLFNLSYREPDRHLDRLKRSAAGAELALGRAGTRDFRLWDGLTFLLKKVT